MNDCKSIKQQLEQQNKNVKKLAPLGTGRACRSLSGCEYERSGWCDHANPKICNSAQKVKKTRKHEVQQWACWKAI